MYSAACSSAQSIADATIVNEFNRASLFPLPALAAISVLEKAQPK
jgi:hypothetical protein